MQSKAKIRPGNLRALRFHKPSFVHFIQVVTVGWETTQSSRLFGPTDKSEPPALVLTVSS